MRFLEDRASSEDRNTDELSTIRRSEMVHDNKIEEENHCKACREALKQIT